MACGGGGAERERERESEEVSERNATERAARGRVRSVGVPHAGGQAEPGPNARHAGSESCSVRTRHKRRVSVCNANDNDATTSAANSCPTRSPQRSPPLATVRPKIREAPVQCKCVVYDVTHDDVSPSSSPSSKPDPSSRCRCRPLSTDAVTSCAAFVPRRPPRDHCALSALHR